MKLLARMKKTLAVATITAILASTSITTMAQDYNNHWAKSAITEWSAYGVVGGYEDGTFKPNNDVTRAELATFITRVFGLTDSKTNTYTDISGGAWYRDAVAKVTAAGIMQGANGKFNPNATATRQETAVVLARAYKLTSSNTKSFKDDNQIAAWAQQSVKALAAGDYIGGRPDGNFDPKANVTRAEVISILDRLTDNFVNKAGTYTGDKTGNTLVNTKDVVLEGMTIAGNLYLAEGIGKGDATLNNATVKGEVFVAGGGVDSITFFECVLDKGVKVTANNPVRIISKGNKISIMAEEGTHVVLTGIFNHIEITPGVTLELKAATVDLLTVKPSASDAKAIITINAASTVKKIVANATVSITGTGRIIELVVNAAGVTTTIKPTTTTVKDGIDFALPGSGGGGSGGGTGGGGGGGIVTPVAKPIIVSAVSLYDGLELVWTAPVGTGNIIKLSEASLQGKGAAEVDNIILALNVDKDADVTLANALGSQVFKANEPYALTAFIAFGQNSKTKLIDDAVKLLAAFDAFTEEAARTYLEGKIAEFEAAAGVSLGDLAPADGKLSIGNTVATLNELHAYATTTERKALLTSILTAVGITATGTGNEIVYEMKATLKATGFDNTLVTIQISK